MAEEKKDWTGTIIGLVAAGLVGLFFVGPQQNARNNANDIGGIDVLRTQIEQIDAEINSIQADTLGRPELDSRLQALAAQIATVEKDIDDTIIRRFGEDVAEPISQVRNDNEKHEDLIVDLLQRMARIEAIVEKLN